MVAYTVVGLHVERGAGQGILDAQNSGPMGPWRCERHTLIIFILECSLLGTPALGH